MNEVTVKPIPGLYAAGIEIGRSQDRGYYHLGLSLYRRDESSARTPRRGQRS